NRSERGGRDIGAKALLETVTPAAVVALGEMRLGLLPLGVGERAIQEVLQELLATIARLAGHESASSASCCFNARRPRCSRDMTVPIGMSRICAASAYEKSPMSTRTTTSRTCGWISESALTMESCESRSTTSSDSSASSPAAEAILFAR